MPTMDNTFEFMKIAPGRPGAGAVYIVLRHLFTLPGHGRTVRGLSFDALSYEELIDDIDNLIAQLEALKKRARSVMPS